MTAPLPDRRRKWDEAIRVTVGFLSAFASLGLGVLGIILVGFLGDPHNPHRVLANALMAFCIVYAGVAGYLGYRFALRSWAWWAVWAVAALVVVPFTLLQGLIHVLD